MKRDIAYLKSRFETGDIPTEEDFIDLFDSLLHYLQVKQTTGQSTTDIMSQKAVTDALAAVSSSWGNISGTITNQTDLINYIAQEIASLVDSSPATLDTLNELAAALGDDPNFATTVTNLLSAKVDKDGGDSQLIHEPEDDDNSTGFFAGLLTLKTNTALLLKTALDRIVSFIQNEVFKVSDFDVSGINEGESQVPIITKTSGVPAIGTPLALENLFIAPTNLTYATFTNGRATATGIPGQRSQDANWQYLCIGINEWTRYPILWDKKEILTVAGADRTPAQLVSDYPNAIAGMWVVGINYAYLSTGVNTWKRIAIENTW